jgi:hypothetical protein
MKTEVRNKGPCDLRGTAPTLRRNVISGEYLRRIHEFVESLPTKQVHCSNNVSKKDPSSSLNIQGASRDVCKEDQILMIK